MEPKSIVLSKPHDSQHPGKLHRIDSKTKDILRLQHFIYSPQNLQKLCKGNDIYFHESTTKGNLKRALQDHINGGKLQVWEKKRAEQLLNEIQQEIAENKKVSLPS